MTVVMLLSVFSAVLADTQIPCPDCGGTGKEVDPPETCAYCLGNWHITCAYCGGVGKIKCDTCHGNDENCPDYGGTGYGSVCDSCGGKGWNPCVHCDESMVSWVWTCWNRGGTGFITVPDPESRGA